MAKAEDLIQAGVRIVTGDAASPHQWIDAAAGCDVLVDLIQPRLPSRIGQKEIALVAEERVEVTRRLLEALKTIPPSRRPRLFSVSGLDDLGPDENNVVTEQSNPPLELRGFAHIGVPLRKAIEDSGLDSTFLYLGVVYGPGKAFAQGIIPKVAAGRFRYPGGGANRVPLVHVDDVARAVVHIAGLPPHTVTHRSIVIADGHSATMNQFLGFAALLLGAPPTSTLPLWIARKLVGSVMCEALTRNIAARPDALRSSGFQFKYSSYAEGLPATLEKLGYSIRPIPHPQPVARKFAISLPLAILIPLAVAAIITVNCCDLPYSAVRIQHYSDGLPQLDMRFHYSEFDVYELFERLGPVGRKTNLRFYWSWDLLLPFLFGSSLWLIIRKTRMKKLRWLAFFASGFDYAENVCISILLMQSSQLITSLATASAWLTTAKWVAYACAIVAATLGCADLYRNSRRQRAELVGN